MQLHIHCYKLKLCDCSSATASFITRVDLKIVGIFRNWNVFSQGSVNTFACKSLRMWLTGGAGNTADGNCPVSCVYSQLDGAVCSAYVTGWLLHSHVSCIWSWSSFHMELIWNPPLPTRCIWVLEICLWELLGFMIFTVLSENHTCMFMQIPFYCILNT